MMTSGQPLAPTVKVAASLLSPHPSRRARHPHHLCAAAPLHCSPLRL